MVEGNLFVKTTCRRVFDLYHPAHLAVSTEQLFVRLQCKSRPFFRMFIPVSKCTQCSKLLQLYSSHSYGIYALRSSLSCQNGRNFPNKIKQYLGQNKMWMVGVIQQHEAVRQRKVAAPQPGALLSPFPPDMRPTSCPHHSLGKFTHHHNCIVFLQNSYIHLPLPRQKSLLVLCISSCYHSRYLYNVFGLNLTQCSGSRLKL